MKPIFQLLFLLLSIVATSIATSDNSLPNQNSRCDFSYPNSMSCSASGTKFTLETKIIDKDLIKITSIHVITDTKSYNVPVKSKPYIDIGDVGSISTQDIYFDGLPDLSITKNGVKYHIDALSSLLVLH